MRLGGGHFKTLGIVPRALATAAIWSIAVVMEMRLRAPIAGIALGALALSLTLVVWLTRGEEGN